MHGINPPVSAASGTSHGGPPKHHRYSSRSNSVSGSSVGTIKRTASLSSTSPGTRNSALPMRPQSPSDTSLIALRLGGGQVSQVGKRRKSVALDPTQPSASEGLGNLHRWSQSTDSSAASPGTTRRHRASSGAALANQPFSPPRTAHRNIIDHSPRSRDGPHKKYLASPPTVPRSQYSPANSPDRGRRQPSQTTVPYSVPSTTSPLYITTSRTLTNDTESPSTTQTGTPSTSGLPTPSTQSSYAQDYFGAENVSPRSMAVSARPGMGRTVTAPATALNYSRMPRSEAVQESVHKRRQSEMIMNPEAGSRPVTAIMAGEGRSERRPRTRERTERDKKAMLSKALQKANTAVLLDNAQNFEGALDAYRDACRLLQQVMDRSPGAEDKRKLEAIKVTYTNRIDELQQLEDSRLPMREEKGLPSRPTSDDGSVKSPIDAPSPVGVSKRASTVIETARSATMARVTEVPRLAFPAKDRDSFFSRTLADVERAGRGNDEPPEEKPSTASETVHEEESGSEDLEPEEPLLEEEAAHQRPREESDPYMPAPLLPRKQPSPTFEPPVQPSWHPEAPASRPNEQSDPSGDRTESDASVSWLDTIDESGSSCGSSIHSRTSKQDLHRKHIRKESGDTVADLDAAYDAAVEAAYDEGLEPDTDGRARHDTVNSHARNESIVVPSSDIKEMLSPTAPFHAGRSLAEEMDDEEEERLLDEMTMDYGHGFNFDLHTKSALPRQSDSSGYSRSTWQSSQGADRTTAGTSLSTVPEDLLSARLSAGKHASVVSSVNTVRAEAPPLQWPPPTGALPRPPSLAEKRASGVRSRRLSGQNAKELKIETSTTSQEGRKRASTFHNSPVAPFGEEAEKKPVEDEPKLGAPMPLDTTVSEPPGSGLLQSPPELRSAVSQSSIPTTTASTEPRESLDEPAELRFARPNFFRKNKSSISLRDNLVSLPSRDDSDHTSSTPMSATFAALRNKHDPITSQRAIFPFHSTLPTDGQFAGAAHLFDTTLTAQQEPASPRSGAEGDQPFGLEPCPEAFMLRPFWLLRAIGSTITHQRGGFLTTRLFVPRDVWHTRGVKLKALDDKIANCDLLTAALGRLALVDTYDADAIMEELQSFEEVMERVQAALVKKLGSDVGVQGAMALFKDTPGGPPASAASATTGTEGAGAPTEKAAKSSSGKSYLTSWRKLRSKSSGTPLATAAPSAKLPGTTSGAEKGEPQTMASVPMSNYIPVERRGQKTGREIKGMVFEGPQKEYMGSLARLVQGVGVLDQIARQVEDPGLRHSSLTHVGLELSMRHAAEFFAFHVCRFVLADLGVLVDKFVKRGTEWALA